MRGLLTVSITKTNYIRRRELPGSPVIIAFGAQRTRRFLIPTQMILDSGRTDKFDGHHERYQWLHEHQRVNRH
jgi:hypothetical protein